MPPRMGRPVPPRSRVRAPHRLLLPVTAAGAALFVSTVQPPSAPQAGPDTVPVAAVSCAAGVWKADYYANTTLTGTPRKSLCDKAVSENWGKGHPAGISLPNDRFGVRWTMRRNFGGGGPFLLKTAAQDGIRVWVDGKRYVNLWRDYASTQRASVKVTVPAGTHTVRVDYVAYTGSANVSAGLAPTTPDKVAPLAPGSAKATPGDARATVSWARNAEADLAGYRVYRSTSTPVKIDTAHRVSGSALLTGNSFNSTGLRNGTKYWFAVTAVDRSGNQSRASADVSAVPADKTPPKAPDILGADGFGDIDLNGNGVPDEGDELGHNFLSWGQSWDDDFSTTDAFAGYHIYRATAPGGPWTRIRSADARVVQDNGYDDTGAPIGVTAYYKVTAVDTAGNESAPATTEPGEYAQTVASALRPDTGLYPPQRPTGLMGSSSEDKAVLDWTANPFGSPVHGLTAGYQVQSAASASGPWDLLVGADTPHHAVVHRHRPARGRYPPLPGACRRQGHRRRHIAHVLGLDRAGLRQPPAAARHHRAPGARRARGHRTRRRHHRHPGLDHHRLARLRAGLRRLPDHPEHERRRPVHRQRERPHAPVRGPAGRR